MDKPPRFRNRNVARDKEGNRLPDVITPRPEQIVTGADRGQALRHFLDKNAISVAAFAEKVGVSRATLHTYLKGKPDLAYIGRSKAEKLITAMGIYDVDAWEELGIPEDARADFRTFRPAPWGHGQVSDPLEPKTRRILLKDTRLVGEETLSHATAIIVDPSATEKIQIVELEDGRYFSVTPEMLKHAGGKHLGGLVGAEF